MKMTQVAEKVAVKDFGKSKESRKLELAFELVASYLTPEGVKSYKKNSCDVKCQVPNFSRVSGVRFYKSKDGYMIKAYFLLEKQADWPVGFFGWPLRYELQVAAGEKMKAIFLGGKKVLSRKGGKGIYYLDLWITEDSGDLTAVAKEGVKVLLGDGSLSFVLRVIASFTEGRLVGLHIPPLSLS